MLDLILSSIISNSYAHSIQNEEYVNRACAYVVGIPYASDNFIDEEWDRFVFCKKLING